MGKYLDSVGLAYLIKKMKNADRLNEQKITNLSTNVQANTESLATVRTKVNTVIDDNNKILESALPSSITGALNFVGEYFIEANDDYDEGGGTISGVLEFDNSITGLISDNELTDRPSQVEPGVLFEVYGESVQLKSSLPADLKRALWGSYVIVNTDISNYSSDNFLNKLEIKVGDWLVINSDGRVLKIDNTLPTSMTEAEVQEIYNSTSSDY